MDCAPPDDVEITLDGFDCEGLVQYSINGGSRSGYFCAESFGKIQASKRFTGTISQFQPDHNQVLQFVDLKR